MYVGADVETLNLTDYCLDGTIRSTTLSRSDERLVDLCCHPVVAAAAVAAAVIVK